MERYITHTVVLTMLTSNHIEVKLRTGIYHFVHIRGEIFTMGHVHCEVGKSIAAVLPKTEW